MSPRDNRRASKKSSRPGASGRGTGVRGTGGPKRGVRGGAPKRGAPEKGPDGPRGPRRDDARGPHGPLRGAIESPGSPGGSRTRPALSRDFVWVFGRNVVQEALNAGRKVDQIWIATGSENISALCRTAEAAGVRIQTTKRSNIDQWAGTDRHQGVFAGVAEYHLVELEPLLDELDEQAKHPFLLLLNEVQDPHNLGSILRTADAAGVDAVILPFRRSVGLTVTVAKSSAGAIEHVRVAEAPNLNRLVEKLKERGYWIAGAEADGATDYREPDFNIPLALLIGGEDKGIGQALRQKCDWTVRLPMQGHLNSLNASVAAALLMYQVVQSRSVGEVPDVSTPEP